MAKYECKILGINHVLITAPKMIGRFELSFTKDYAAHLHYFDGQDRNHLIGQYFGSISKKYGDDFKEMTLKTVRDHFNERMKIYYG